MTENEHRLLELQRALQEANRNAQQCEAAAERHQKEAARLRGEIYTFGQAAKASETPARMATHAGRADGTTAGRSVTGRGR